MNKIHYRTCNLCEAMCGIKIEHVNGAIQSIKGDEKDPFSKGYICPKAVALQDIYNDPDRLKRPVKKTSSGWAEIPWREAFDLVESKIKAVQKKHGNNSIGAFLGNPNVHNYGSILYGPQFFKLLKSKNIYSATSVDQLPHHFVCQEMYGNSMFIPVPDIDRTDLFIIMGGNPMASNGSMMTAAGMPRRLKALQERGGKFIVIDPRKTETAKKADLYLPIKPGSDVYLLAAIIRTILQNKWHDESCVELLNGNLEELHTILDEFDLPAASKKTGIAENEILQLSKDIALAGKAVCYGRMGLSVQKYGNLCQWLIQVLNIVSGNMDREGGQMFPLPAVTMSRQSKRYPYKSKYNRWQSRVRKLPEFRGELPVCTLIDELNTSGEGQIKAVITAAGNPVISTPNGNALEQALENLDFMVSIDIYINETTSHADVILPTTTGLETDHYDLIFNNFVVRNTAKFSEALFKPVGGALHDWQIYKELIKRFTKNKGFITRILHNWMTPKRMINIGLKKGPYNLSIKQLKRQPHGIDLGALKPCLPSRLFTKDKKIQLIPDLLKLDLGRVRSDLRQSKQNGKLQLIGRRELRSNNSWMHNIERLVKGPLRCTLLIHPEDASAKGLTDKQLVTVKTHVGEISVPIKISTDVMKGVVCIPHGYGHDKKGVKMRTASKFAGASYNDLTDGKEIDPLTGNAVLNGIEVEVFAS